MRPIALTALLLGMAACTETGSTSAPTSVPPNDLSVPSSLDLSANAPPTPDLATAPTFPTTATVTVGPGGSLSFAPATVDISAGGTVTWNWAGSAMPHNVTSGDPTPAFAASPTQTSGSFQATFVSAGSFFYYCSVHGRNVMNGTVVVH